MVKIRTQIAPTINPATKISNSNMKCVKHIDMLSANIQLSDWCLNLIAEYLQTIIISMANGGHRPVATSHFIYGVQIRCPCDDMIGPYNLTTFFSDYDQVLGLTFITIRHTMSRCDRHSVDKDGFEINRVCTIPYITPSDTQKLREILDYCKEHDIYVDCAGMMHFVFMDDR